MIYSIYMGERTRQTDLAWIDQNRDIFWLSATTAFEEVGRGVPIVNLHQEPLDQGQPFSYHAEGELEIQDEKLKGHLDGYDPGREFIVVLQKPSANAIYRGRRPEIGWMTDLQTRTPYESEDSNGARTNLNCRKLLQASKQGDSDQLRAEAG